jgi:hypothetical protein
VSGGPTIDLKNMWSGQPHVPAALLPEKASNTSWTGGCVGPQTGLKSVEKREITCSYRESNSRSSVVQPIA